MISALIIGIIIFFFICFIVSIPIAAVKAAKTKKQPCPSCESEIRFAMNHGKCPRCRTKIYKHGDGTLRLRT